MMPWPHEYAGGPLVIREDRTRIRHAEDHDLPELLRMARAFAEADSPDVPFVEDDMARWIRRFRKDDAVLVGEGMTAAVFVVPLLYNSAVQQAYEQWIWIDPEHRKPGALGSLIAAMEAWAQSKGARWLNIGALPWLRGEVVGRLYRRFGYEPSFNLYRKTL